MSGPGVNDIGGCRSYDVTVLASRMLALLATQLPRRVPEAELATALGVPGWVASVVLHSLQQQGDALGGPDGWRLSCSASVALGLSLPAHLRRGAR